MIGMCRSGVRASKDLPISQDFVNMQKQLMSPFSGTHFLRHTLKWYVFYPISIWVRVQGDPTQVTPHTLFWYTEAKQKMVSPEI